MDTDWMIPGLIRRGQTHLLCGSGGSGKTTLALQLMDAAANPGDDGFGRVLGLKVGISTPILASMDLRRRYYHRKARELGLELDEEDFTDRLEIHDDALEILERSYKDRDLWVIEGFLRLLPTGNMNSQHETAALMARLNDLCQRCGITIIGVVPKAKMRRGNEISGLRDRVAGATALAAGADTVILIEPNDPDDPKDNHREVYLLPKDREALRLYARINPDGRLEEGVAAPKSVMDRRLEEMASGGVATTAQILAWDPNVSRKTVFRWISDKCDEGALVKESHGVYRKPRVS